MRSYNHSLVVTDRRCLPVCETVAAAVWRWSELDCVSVGRSSKDDAEGCPPLPRCFGGDLIKRHLASRLDTGRWHASSVVPHTSRRAASLSGGNTGRCVGFICGCTTWFGLYHRRNHMRENHLYYYCFIKEEWGILFLCTLVKVIT